MPPDALSLIRAPFPTAVENIGSFVLDICVFRIRAPTGPCQTEM